MKTDVLDVLVVFGCILIVQPLLAGAQGSTPESTASRSPIQQHWGVVTHEAQLSIALPKQSFTNGEPIYATVTLRNTGNTDLFFYEGYDWEALTEFRLFKNGKRVLAFNDPKDDSFKERLKTLRNGSFAFMTNAPGAEWKRTHLLQNRYDLTNGTYQIWAERRSIIMRGSEKELTIRSGETSFTILPVEPPPDQASDLLNEMKLTLELLMMLLAVHSMAQTSTETIANKAAQQHWGTVANEAQLSIALPKQSFTNGEPIYATVTLRNTGNTDLYFWEGYDWEALTEFRLFKDGKRVLAFNDPKDDSFNERLKTLRNGSFANMTNAPGAEWKRTHLLQERYDLTNGTYQIWAERRRVNVRGSEKSFTIRSGETSFTILPVEPPPGSGK